MARVMAASTARSAAMSAAAARSPTKSNSPGSEVSSPAKGSVAESSGTPATSWRRCNEAPAANERRPEVCDRCNEIRDVYVSGSDALSITGLDGFAVSNTSILFNGLCPRCAADSE